MMIKYVSADYSVHLKILSFNPDQVDKVGEVLFDKMISSNAGAGENDAVGSALSHNNLYLTYGQWVFFYTITLDHGKYTIQLVKVDLNDTEAGAKEVGDPYVILSS